ncbi:MAG: NAD(P)/FAD-dependent oxidoreductase [Candidatus Eisenbacteria bacterium]
METQDRDTRTPDPPGSVTSTELAIIGAGPVGLFAAFYAGLRSMRVTLVDSLAELGGQLSALYPDKFIYDVAGFPKVKSRDLVTALAEQALQYQPEVRLEERVTGLTRTGEGWTLTTARGTTLEARTVLITAGVGAFAPRKLENAGLARFEGHGLHYVLPSLEPFAGRRILLTGGGDSALDWALHLEPIAKEIILIHRRDRFRAHEDSVAKLEASRARIMTFTELKTIEGDGRVERVIVFDNRTQAETVLEVDDVVVNFGFVADLGPIKTWGLEIKGNSLIVNPKMETNLPGVFAAGDIVSYVGKLKLIATGFGEAAMAVCGAKMVVDPKARYFPGHSSETATEGVVHL